MFDLHRLTIDASVPDRAVVTDYFDKFASAVSPDGRQVALTEDTHTDRILLAPLDGSARRSSSARPASRSGLPSFPRMSAGSRTSRRPADGTTCTSARRAGRAAPARCRETAGQSRGGPEGGERSSTGAASS